ncbi:acid phosphatase [Saitoella complicata NRRL Y-17804]|uniref:acid phosphatase n=1 Tax=Saitoella complicata (strain BCRC 22490 / CBS 7301 / JCM 7358 / NBRC 10748 / NRRL Y-17804) TaxID=698492 RepID=UPI000866C2A0|nr:acid phosphatase [Saitoella complicata NRRL Y-17804]ODQ56190.1 acid phosphatase [Saitoella complicata NRRL Y-17804]
MQGAYTHEKLAPQAQGRQLSTRPRRRLRIWLSALPSLLVILSLFSLYSDTIDTLSYESKPTLSWIMRHLAGPGPWVPAKGIGIGYDVPPFCEVEQVHMVSRHGERYPTGNDFHRIEDLFNRVKKAMKEGVKAQGDFGFLNTYETPIFAPDLQVEQLTLSGPYAGSADLFRRGALFRARYQHLHNVTSSTKHKVFASDDNRVIDSAKYFIQGFFGLHYEDTANLVVIPEDPELGADSLTPAPACPKWSGSAGAEASQAFEKTYEGPIADRLNDMSPGFNFTHQDVVIMQDLCGYDLNILGISPWCQIFTQEEWLLHEYTRDVWAYYHSGYGQSVNRDGALGVPWALATTDLLKQGSDAGSLFFQFTHDTDVLTFLSAFGLFNDSAPLPKDQMPYNRNFRSAEIIPMGGHMVIERLACTHANPPSPKYKKDDPSYFVRILVNDALIPLGPSTTGQCSSGPGFSCPLDEFVEIMEKKSEEVGTFSERCGVERPDKITFLTQD